MRTVAGPLPMSASIGIHVATDDDYDMLLRAADRAMHDAIQHPRHVSAETRPDGAGPRSAN